MQHLEGSGTPVLYTGRTVLKGYGTLTKLLEGMIRGMEGLYAGLCRFLRK